MATATQAAKPNKTRLTLIALGALAILAIVAIMAIMAALVGSRTTTPSVPAPGPAKAAAGLSNVGLTEFAITGVPATMAAGKATVTITNSGSIDHEVLVFKSELDAAKYPVDANGRIIEEGAGVTKVSDGDNVAAGKTQQRVIDLSTPGKYLFVCNLPSHFGSGMYTVVTVK